MRNIQIMLPEGVMILKSELSAVKFVKKACIQILDVDSKTDNHLTKARHVQ
jgi:hypothetical protein